MEIPPKERSCLFCEHCFIQMPTSDSSDITAGEEFGAHCHQKQHYWYLHDDYLLNQAPMVLIAAFSTARTCPDFELNQRVAEELGL